jgi:hypothetical protein
MKNYEDITKGGVANILQHPLTPFCLWQNVRLRAGLYRSLSLVQRKMGLKAGLFHAFPAKFTKRLFKRCRCNSPFF